MRVLVTGVKGQLGYHVVQELEKRNHTAIGVDIEEMDITNAEETRKPELQLPPCTRSWAEIVDITDKKG